MKYSKTIMYYTVGTVLLLFGLFLLIGVMASDEPSFPSISDLIIIFIVVVLPIVFGSWFIYLGFRHKRFVRNERMEAAVLKLALELGGSMTVADLAMNTSMSLSQARKTLEIFVSSRIATLKITENGTFVYEFEVAGQKEKNDAKYLNELL
ncbi:hypothetical protein [Paenibacillus sp. J2TS4]|uniref:hypothetical protein n=1 Tax=Paenibacillus sp. J2TS4 TaxID=2807194 RepID=UPI001B08B1AD|nr:hypothetical protein [Paenibacillus sp. J2TS4]GIP34528.1 hypothetical protein J2TS4_37380 [Paenibacillus sp. J2TS4]